MKVVKFDGCNAIYGPPKGVSESEVASIPVMKFIDEKQIPCLIIKIDPSQLDLQALNKGQGLYLQIMGEQLIPFAIYTLNENGMPNEIEYPEL